MAITRAQQIRQMLEDGGMLVQPSTNGKRPGYRGSDMASVAGENRAANTSQKDTSGADYGGGNQGRDAATSSGADDRSSALQTYNTKVATGRLSDEDYETVEDVPLNKREETEKENKDLFINKEANYPTYTPSYVKFLGDLNRNPNRKFFYERVLKNNAAGLNYTQLEDEYDKYMSNRLAGYTDAMGNTDPNYRKEGDQYFQIDAGKGGDNTISQNLLEDTTGDTEEEDEVNPRDYTGLAPRFMGSIFDFTGLAEGGRVAAQQGGIMSQQGGIMPRLNDLSGDVSSAEQMLQEINQRLESAESTLGGGGGDPSSGLIAIQPNNFNNFQPRQMPIGQPTLTPAPRYASFGDMMANRIQSDVPTSFTNLEGVRSNPDGTPYTPPDNNQILSLMTNQTPSPQANLPLGPLQPAIQPGIQSPLQVP